MRPFITEDWVFVSFNTWVESSNSQFYPVLAFQDDVLNTKSINGFLSKIYL